MVLRMGFRISQILVILALTLSGEKVDAQRAGCKNVHYDLVFILDTSSSVGKDNFEKIRQWVANLVESFDVGPEKTRVAVVRYSDRPTTEFNLGRYRTLDEVKRAARNIRYLGGNTMTGDAISYITKTIYTEQAGARPVARGIQRVAILLTDGRSQDYVLEPSKEASRAGIRMFAVGIGEALKEELEEIAAEPKNAHVFHVSDFNAIDKIRGKLRRRLCENVLCPNMKVQPDRFKPNSTSAGLKEVPGFDLMEYFNVKDILGTKFEPGQSSFVRLGTMPIVQQTEDVFPQGLPDEYAFVTTFKFRKTSRREDWYLWQIFDKYGIPQVSIRLDGENKAVEYNAVGLTKDAVRAVFKNQEVDNLFDRNWHKIALSVQAKSVALYLDCKHIQTLPIDDREDIDIQGKTVIGKRLYDSVPIDFDLQRMMIYCDSKHAELETCCDLPTGPCPKKVVTEAPPIEIPTPTPKSGEQHSGPKAMNCSCPAGEKRLVHPALEVPRVKRDFLALLEKEEKGETEVNQENWVKQDYLALSAQREFKVMQDFPGHLVPKGCLESPVWMDFLENLAFQGKRDLQVPVAPQVLWVHLVLKDDPESLANLVSGGRKGKVDYLVWMVYLDQQVLKGPLDQLALLDKLDHLVCLVKTGWTVSRGMMAQRGLRVIRV
ncbi:hypothetical protein JZ751_000304 [Albula glossodonta]|uniref:VWFA domain-containing protein n=1 Tax=Albula glossodonta TaxID=121402 RepID=A0A8T2PW70_9TELE|nr:hypothetical protein JZ751_000304 [Albula glossodonta]